MDSGKELAHFIYMENLARAFVIPSRQNQLIHEKAFNNAPIRNIAVAINTNPAIEGSFHEKPFNYRQFQLVELRSNRGRRTLLH